MFVNHYRIVYNYLGDKMVSYPTESFQIVPKLSTTPVVECL